MPKNLLTTAIRSMVAATVLLASPATFAAEGMDRNELSDLRRIIAEQRQRLDAQDRMLSDIQRRMDSMLGRTGTARTAVSASASPRAGRRTMTDATAANTAPDIASAETKKPVTKSGAKSVSLAISGQVNRGILHADDGTNAEVIHVDNDHSSTRFRLVGKGQVSDDLGIGAQIEVQMESNSTGSVSQDGDSDNAIGATSFGERKLEVFFDSKLFGKL